MYVPAPSGLAHFFMLKFYCHFNKKRAKKLPLFNKNKPIF